MSARKSSLALLSQYALEAWPGKEGGWTHHLSILELIRNRHDLLHVIPESELLEGFRDVLARDGLFGVFLCDLVGFGGDHGNEFDAALD